ncbi:hypothetical protein NX059_011004 [Plenodomus lindquistii]|nr:hypothetical protein NX059_011004 [Plenodomus lindquistii]
MKEISSNGNTQTVDVIYPASPFFLYVNPEPINLFIKPHFENQEHGWYPNKSAMHDLGVHYPISTGHEDGKDEEMPLEECGNMIIMVLAYSQFSGNTNYIKEHYHILKQWSEYLVEHALIPSYEFSTHDFAGKLANQTNLALKSIIGLEAMSQISKIAGEDADADNFTATARNYYTNLLYNLYNDRLLNLSLVSQEIYDMQDRFYPTVLETYGVPLDTRNRH